MTIQKTDAEQAKRDAFKTVRAAVRLRHSLEADRELNQVLPAFEKKWKAATLRGEIPAPLDIKKALGL